MPQERNQLTRRETVEVYDFLREQRRQYQDERLSCEEIAARVNSALGAKLRSPLTRHQVARLYSDFEWELPKGGRRANTAHQIDALAARIDRAGERITALHETAQSANLTLLGRIQALEERLAELEKFPLLPSGHERAGDGVAPGGRSDS